MRPIRHVRALDGLRGVAVLAVVLYHFEPSLVPGGFLGVDLFFVLSGFLIASLVLRESATAGSVDLLRFWIRRIRRLMPALLLVILAMALYAAWLATPGELTRIRSHGLATLGYFANWRYIADGTSYTDLVAGTSPLRHTWSLAIEEQFYLVFPLVVVGVLLLVRRDATRTRLVLGGLSVAGIAVSASLMASWFHPGGDPSRVYYGTDTRIHSLLVGVLLGVVTLGDLPIRGRAARPLGFFGAFGAVALLGAFLFVHDTDAWMYRGGFLAVAVVVALVILASGRSRALRTVLGVRPLVGLGLISYGVYLWHWPVFVLVDGYATGLSSVGLFMLRSTLTLGIALLSFVLVEQPIRRGALGRRLGRASVVVAPIAVALAIGVLVWSTAIPFVSRPAAARRRATTVSVSTTLLRVVLFGDSVAHTLAGAQVYEFPDFQPWAPQLSPYDPRLVDLRAVTKPACSFLPGVLAFPGPDGSYTTGDLLRGFCGDWRGDLTRELSAFRPDYLVVLLTNDIGDRKVDGHIVTFGSPEHERLVMQLFGELRSIATSAGSDLVLVAAPPRVGRFTAAWDADGWRELHLGALARQYATSTPGVHWLDLASQICRRADCDDPQSGFDSGWRYDGLHYTPEGAVWVADWLTGELEALPPSA
ncbi:MAG: acyltransferase family protein [Acidimicrobiia bacterium]|nr:acyltransferase family protein [Acidimicrobiia bacterium]